MFVGFLSFFAESVVQWGKKYCLLRKETKSVWPTNNRLLQNLI